MIKHIYDINKYGLKYELQHLFGYSALAHLHNGGGFEMVGHEPGKDNNSEWHKRFYSHMIYSEFMMQYYYFMRDEIRTKFNEAIVFQKFPTLRIQIPEGKGVAAYHVDSEYNHPVDEINVWLPFTHAKDSRSIYIESEPGKADYNPVDCRYGEYIMFEGGKLSHGNEINKTDETRVSIDMRVIPVSKFVPSDKKGLAYGKVRNIGGENAYYDVIK